MRRLPRRRTGRLSCVHGLPRYVNPGRRFSLTDIKMRRYLIIPSLFALVLAILWGACADRKEPTLVKTHPDEWNVKSSPGFHGQKVASTGLISCPGCHGSDYRGGTSEVSCYKCHNGPGGHPRGWFDSSSDNYHGLKVAAEGPSVCAPCHGEDYKGLANKGVSCYKCHDGPSGHPSTGWLDKTSPNYHGLKVAQTGPSTCVACHGEDYKGGTSEVSCYKCHNGPSGHPTGWIDPSSENFLGLRIRASGIGECAPCHGEDYQGGTSGVSCYSCHEGPSGHPIGWFDSSSDNYHGLKVAAEGPSVCAACHGEDYKGGVVDVSCYTCHNGPGGHPSTGWFDSSSDNYHGLKVAQTGPSDCAACHGEDYKGGTSGVSCYTCHNGPSGHPSTGWFDSSSDNYHGLKVAAEGTSVCTACHGEDYKGGAVEVSCYTCHNGPGGHPSTGWFDSSSDNYHGLKVAAEGPSVCAPCHGEDYQGGTSGVSCYTCHDGPGGHPVGWLDSSDSDYHGATVKSQGVSGCTACHGEDLKGGTSGVSCSAEGCH
jgi:uncharacterized CHY-type Zn-finger protein